MQFHLKGCRGCDGCPLEMTLPPSMQMMIHRSFVLRILSSDGCSFFCFYDADGSSHYPILLLLSSIFPLFIYLLSPYYHIIIFMLYNTPCFCSVELWSCQFVLHPPAGLSWLGWRTRLWCGAGRGATGCRIGRFRGLMGGTSTFDLSWNIVSWLLCWDGWKLPGTQHNELDSFLPRTMRHVHNYLHPHSLVDFCRVGRWISYLWCCWQLWRVFHHQNTVTLWNPRKTDMNEWQNKTHFFSGSSLYFIIQCNLLYLLHLYQFKNF